MPNDSVIRAAVFSLSAGRCLRTGRKLDPKSSPTGKRFRELERADQDRMHEFADGSLVEQSKHPGELIRITKDGMDIAIDMHKIERHDRKSCEPPTRDKPKNAMSYSEGYTAHCVVPGMRLTLAVLSMYSGDAVAEFAPGIIESCRMVSKIKMAGSPFRQTTGYLDKESIPYVMPCRNVPCNRAAPKDPRGGRAAVEITSDTQSVPYTMIIARRNGKHDGGELEPERYIGFATGRPETDIEAHRRRWGIETGCSKTDAARAKMCASACIPDYSGYSPINTAHGC